MAVCVPMKTFFVICSFFVTFYINYPKVLLEEKSFLNTKIEDHRFDLCVGKIGSPCKPLNSVSIWIKYVGRNTTSAPHSTCHFNSTKEHKPSVMFDSKLNLRNERIFRLFARSGAIIRNIWKKIHFICVICGIHMEMEYIRFQHTFWHFIWI